MADYTSFKLPSGAMVHVQTTANPPKRQDAGPGQATGAGDRARETWAEGMELVREVAAGVLDKLRPATEKVERVTVEFGVNISGKTGIILVEGTAAANLKVTLSWKGQG